MINNDSFRFSIKFNLNKEHHRTAYEKLNSIKKGDKSEFCINCILGKADENQEIKNLIESTIKSCLNDISITSMSTAVSPSHSTNTLDDNEVDIMDGVLDFMNGL